MKSTQYQLRHEHLFAGKQRLGRKLGKGGFGNIQKAQNVHTQKFVAAKIEANPTKWDWITNETEIYSKLEKKKGIPEFYELVKDGPYLGFIMQLLGSSLEDIFIKNNQKFSLQTVLAIAIQLINLIKQVHSKGIIHRDIKPENFLLHCEKQSEIQIIDFGLAKEYIDPKTNQHIPYKNSQFVGTIDFASVNACFEDEQSRRDDMEGLGYLFAYFFNGGLPWQKFPNDNVSQRIQRKIVTSISEITNGMPKEFEDQMNYCRSLGFYEEPKYDECVGKFTNLVNSLKQDKNKLYDWVSTERMGLQSIKEVEKRKNKEAYAKQLGNEKDLQLENYNIIQFPNKIENPIIHE